jgi:hypothetical protein
MKKICLLATEIVLSTFIYYIIASIAIGELIHIAGLVGFTIGGGILILIPISIGVILHRLSKIHILKECDKSQFWNKNTITSAIALALTILLLIAIANGNY